jgi:hypothetical protein
VIGTDCTTPRDGGSFGARVGFLGGQPKRSDIMVIDPATHAVDIHQKSSWQHLGFGVGLVAAADDLTCRNDFELAAVDVFDG